MTNPTTYIPTPTLYNEETDNKALSRNTIRDYYAAGSLIE